MFLLRLRLGLNLLNIHEFNLFLQIKRKGTFKTTEKEIGRVE